MHEPKTVRFWVYHADSYVRLALRKGDRRTTYFCASTDEGWHSETVTWEWHGGDVLRCRETDGVDCDGRFATCERSSCPVPDLATWVGSDGAPMLPSWRYGRRSQRDYSAEAMGY